MEQRKRPVLISVIVPIYKNNEQLATLLAQKKELAAQLKNQTHFLEYEELENAILHIVAELFYQDGFSDATEFKKKL